MVLNEVNGLDPPNQVSDVEYPAKDPNEVFIFPIWIYLYSVIAAFQSFTFGYNAGIVAAAIVFIPNVKTPEAAAIVGIMLFGAFIGSLIASWLADKLGRKIALIMNYLFAFLAALGSALAYQSWQLIIWRLLVGFGVGVTSVIPSLYITELSPPEIRGTLSTVNQFAGSFGIVLSYFMGATIIACTEIECWRWMFGTGSIIAVIGFILTFAIPESPRWLLSQKRREEAIVIVERLYGNFNQEKMESEFRAMSDSSKDLKMNWLDLGRRKYVKPLLTMSLLPALQGFSGNTTLIYYSAMIFTSMGIPKGKAVLFTAITGLPQIASLLMATMLMDRLGRRSLLIISIGCCTLASLLIGLFIYFLPSVTYWAVFVGILLFRFFYSLGLGPVPQVICPELLPFMIRSRGTAISLGVYWLSVAIVASSFPPLITKIPSYAMYWFFSGFLLLGLILVFNFIKETKGRALEVIEALHLLPVLSPDGYNRSQLPQDSLIAQLRPVKIPIPPSASQSSPSIIVNPQI
jgi:sugar porter (SP) family MFS transporter